MFHNLLGGLGASASGLSFSKILFGLSRSLQIAKNIVPIYEQVSPLIKKVPSVMNKISTFRNQIYNINTSSLSNSSNNNIINTQKKSIKADNSNIFGPTFFQ